MESAITIGVSMLALLFSVISFYRSYKTTIQPIIIFCNDAADKENITTWYAKNVGYGPAINVVLMGGDTIKIMGDEDSFIVPAMEVGMKERLNFLKKRNALVATYRDIKGRPYTTVCVQSNNKVYEKNLFPKVSPKHSFYEVKSIKTK